MIIKFENRKLHFLSSVSCKDFDYLGEFSPILGLSLIETKDEWKKLGQIWRTMVILAYEGKG